MRGIPGTAGEIARYSVFIVYLVFSIVLEIINLKKEKKNGHQ